MPSLSLKTTSLKLLAGAALWCIWTELSAQGSNNSALVLPGGEESLWESVSAEYDTVYRKASEAVPLERLLMPWETTRAVALALPLGELEENKDLESLFKDTLAALLPRVEVVAYYHRLDRRALGAFWGRLESDDRIAPYLNRLSLEASEAFSIWMRDFGPQFAKGIEDSLVLLDPSVGDPGATRGQLFDVKTTEDPIQQHFKMVEELGNLRGLEGSDRIPVLMAGMLEAKWGIETQLSRPPLYLQGGDFLPVNTKAALVSESTLRANGGTAQNFRKTVEKYYGVDTIVFLENLPGKTIEHLDFVVQPIRENVVLMAEPPQGIKGKRSYHRLLDQELKASFARNEAIVRKAFPESTIIKVPMPPPAFDSDEDVRRELFLKALQVFVTEERIAMRFDPALALANWDAFEFNPRIESKLEADAGIADWKSSTGQERVIERYLGETYPDLLASHVEPQINYRSYVNSLFVKSLDGGEIVLIPRFKARSEDEKALMTELEKQVVAAYKKACPDAEQIWIDCTVLTDFMGMIHCFTLTIPSITGLE
ncbi:agmatine deiminase family protein [Pelagicoccus sp. SDUM812002]|uniref:agmatine deiminase family protein n=1 Tax=Pelagicoccus sp. SDUM812002 TaxID=3041266 RepID=UPI00280F2F5E|nr:agmatine deiminase family protein [Pelagicoccus sp. SDUM812002]MDQ8184036.1 agmatine deiminase family protein [Pelagicoccus sp. SDUM812002]